MLIKQVSKYKHVFVLFVFVVVVFFWISVYVRSSSIYISRNLPIIKVYSMKYYKKNQKGQHPRWIECTETEYNQLPANQRLKSFYALIGA